MSETPSEFQPTLSTVLAKLQTLGITVPPGRVRLDGYGDSAALSEELLALIRQGNKRAGTGLIWGLEADHDPMPQVLAAGALGILLARVQADWPRAQRDDAGGVQRL